MLKFLSCGLMALALLGCATGADGDQRYSGVIERIQKISRVGQPSGILMAFGAVGGLLHHAASQSTPTNLYVVRAASGERYSVQVDEEFSMGACVEVIPNKSAISSKSYTYGDARLVRSERCPG